MSDRARILIAEPEGFSAAAIARLETIGDVERREIRSAEVADALADCDVFWFRLAHRIDERALARARARILATAVTGLDHIDLEACRARGVRVVSLRGEAEFLRDVRATAEHTIALTLALLRRLPAAARSVVEGRWDRAPFRGHELHRKVAGVVGMGRLGTIVAGYFRAFGMEVIGADPRADFPHDAATKVSLDELLARADVVSLHVSYSNETRHLVGAAELARMKSTAILVNTARGGVIDEAALVDALAREAIAGAALDVLDGEPNITADHRLVRLAATSDRLVLTPHVGGNTIESFEKTERFLAERVIEAWRSG